jgi:hypothetical protein
MVGIKRRLGGKVLAETTLSSLNSARHERLREVECLRTAGFLGMALALRLYALEIQIKILVCEHPGLEFLPSACKTHDLRERIDFIGRVRDLLAPDDSGAVRLSWDRVEEFSRNHLNVLRYRSQSSFDQVEIAEIFEALDDPDRGVAAWLSNPT